jgi:uroporphyrinogen-III synthase
MREVALDENPALEDFARHLIAGEYDVVVLMTGVGFRLLLRSLEGKVDTPSFLDALNRATTIARGPKPVAAMHEAGLSPTIRIGEPNTWRDILAACSAQPLQMQGRRVAIQEHGLPSRELYAGLESLGATVTGVPVYQWALPEDTKPLEANLHAICDGERDVALFTSSRQLVHVMAMALQLDLEASLRTALGRMANGSIGPVTSETMREYGIEPDFEPEHPKLGYLVIKAAEVAPGLVREKLSRAPSRTG